jgi:tRNA threonylcarbamoyladenosine biosynthesis protein TsaB
MRNNSQPRFLILETSGRVGQVAVAEGEHLLDCRRLDEARHHARDLVPAVSELLTMYGWQPQDVQAVVVSRGPGSYTGLRIGIVSAKTYTYVTGSTLLAVDSFAAIAIQAPAEVHSVEVLTDAQQDQVYVQGFHRLDADTWVAGSALRIQRWADWLNQRDPNTWITGPGLRTYGDRLPEEARVVPTEVWNPQAESLLRIGLARYRAGEQDDPWTVEPLYLRPSSAEVKWQQR